MTELLPCPFCGGRYVQVRYIGGEWQEPSAFESGYRGECCDCYAITAAYYTEAEAAAAWNTRHEEIVRCRDCRYYEHEVFTFGERRDEYHWCNRDWNGEPVLSAVEPDGFCAWGERRREG